MVKGDEGKAVVDFKCHMLIGYLLRLLFFEKALIFRYALVKLHPSGIESHRHHIVLTDGKDYIEYLFFVEVFLQFCKGGVTDKRIGVQFVGGFN